MECAAAEGSCDRTYSVQEAACTHPIRCMAPFCEVKRKPACSMVKVRQHEPVR